MSKVVRARYEKGVLVPLEPLELREGEEVRLKLLPEELPKLIEELSEEAEARASIDEALGEARRRWRRWY